MLGQRGTDGTRAPKSQHFTARTSPTEAGEGSLGLGPMGAGALLPLEENGF